ncbi:MAG: NAD(P)H-hydrate epimerase [Planctomycetes bacterium]|nr:NAD(P)H-hydrate epimerase [Planctomycetota bacterium]
MSREQVRGFDSWAINTASVPGVVLMENAGRSCAELIEQSLSEKKGNTVCIFCGGGNNGGDGFVIARHLSNAGIETVTVVCSDPVRIKGDALTNYRILQKIGLKTEHLNPGDDDLEQKVKSLSSGSAIIVDALFGTGLSGPLRAGYDILVTAINALCKPVIAVDIPTGLDCDTGLPTGAAIKAQTTVTFVAAKKGFANPQAEKYTGQVYIASIGVEPVPNINFS